VTRGAACLLAILLAGCRHPEAPPPGDLAEREGIGSKRSIAPICSVLAHSPNADVRVACLAALGARKEPAAAQAALPSLQDPAEMVRAAALDVVEARRPEGATDAVAAMYAWLPPSGAWHEKERLLADLVVWKDPRACGMLLDALANPFSSPTRREAARLLGELGDPRGVAALLEAIGDSRPEVALASHQSLARLTGRTDAPEASVDDAKGRAALRAEWKAWIERRR